jgi:predicted transposase YbfD/YdcC
LTSTPAWPSLKRPGLFPPEGRHPTPPPPPAELFATTVEKNRGRIERRTLESTSILTATGQWPGLKQGFRIRREVTNRGQTTVEIVHGITSLSLEQANAEQLLELVRDNWKIENSLHYVRDVTLGEDACRVRSGQAPQTLAACRNTVLFLLQQVPGASNAEALRRLAARPDEAINLLNSQL